MKNRAKFIALRAVAVFFIIAMPLYAESCASIAHGGYGGSGWKRCPKARECPPTPLVARDKFELNTSWSTANGPTNQRARTTKAALAIFERRKSGWD